MKFTVKLDDKTKDWLVYYVDYIIKRLQNLNIEIKVNDNDTK